MPCTCRTENEKQHNFLRWVQNKWAYMVSIVYIEANQFCIETVGPEWVKGRISVDAGACQSALLYAPRVREGSEKKNAFTDCCKGVSFGGSRGSRTPDPLLVRQTLWTNWAMLPTFKRTCSFAVRTGLEPATPGVTGRYSNQLNYRTILFSLYAFSLNADAKVRKKSEPPNFFELFLWFFAKKMTAGLFWSAVWWSSESEKQWKSMYSGRNRYFTSIARFFSSFSVSCAFGIMTFRTPSLTRASIFSLSAFSGSMRVWWNLE